MSTYAERLAYFGFCSVARGCDPENNDRLRNELEDFVTRENVQRLSQRQPRLILEEGEMCFSIYSKSAVTSADKPKKRK